MRRWIVMLSLVPLLVSGCGDRSLILTVDILSFLDPAEVSQAYGPIPGGLAGVSIDITSDELSLLPGIEDVTEAVSASLQIGASFDNATGTADVEFQVYITSAESSDVFSTPPVADVPLTLTPGNVTNVSTEVSSAALAAALIQDKARIGIRITFDTTPSGATPVQGNETVTLLRATVITQKQL
jgi:hypothetical protein